MVDGAPGALDGGVVVEDGVIQELVRRDQLESRRADGTRVIDVGERPVLPGFVDPHAHVEVACRAAYGTVDIRAPECRNVADIQDRLAAALPDAEATGWVVAQANLSSIGSSRSAGCQPGGNSTTFHRRFRLPCVPVPITPQER